MASSDPISVGFGLLYATLSGDSAFNSGVGGQIYQVMAPAGATPPYCLLISQSARDTNSANAVRILSTLLYQVKLVGPVESASTLRSLWAQADALLQPGGQPLRNTQGALACFREEALSIGELVNGALWLNVGGLYRIEV